MGQVLLVGNGRLSRHLQHYFHLLDLDFRVWTRQAELPFPDALRGSSHVLLAIRDDALEEFLAENPMPHCTVVHFSGSLVVHGAYSAHPLMTFSQRPYSLKEYRNVPFIIDADAPAFSRLLPGLPNPHYRLDATRKNLYHALCVLGGNYTQMLWQHVFARMDTLGIPRQALYPYLRRVADNLEAEGAPLTGPLVRGDHCTIERNLAALAGDAYQEVYRSFVKAYDVP